MSNGDGVRARRERLGASQAEVAQEAGVNRDTVAAVESGRARVKSHQSVEAALSRLEAAAAPASIEETLRVEVPNPDGGPPLVVVGPAGSPEALADAVKAIVRRLG